MCQVKIDFYFIRQTSIYCLKFQGQALSTLVRAYLESKDDRCLAAAEDGVRVFSISSSEGGVRAVLMDKYEWYEEYPTNPPTFILNGFMYSLLGLYDLIKVSVWVRCWTPFIWPNARMLMFRNQEDLAVLSNGKLVNLSWTQVFNPP